MLMAQSLRKYQAQPSLNNGRDLAKLAGNTCMVVMEWGLDHEKIVSLEEIHG